MCVLFVCCLILECRSKFVYHPRGVCFSMMCVVIVVVVVVVVCCSLFLVVVVICRLLLFIASNPRLPFNILLFVAWLCLFVVGLFVCLFVP